jgi:hypothetical protein
MYELYDTEWRSLSVVEARSFREARAAFEPFYKGTFWIEHIRSGETKKVRL